MGRFALVLLVLSACGDEKDFSLAGIDRPRDVRRFLNELKDSVDAGDLKALAALVRYPFTTYKSGIPVRTYANPAELLADRDRVFTPRVLNAILEQRVETLFVNYQGVMIGGGDVWFDGFDGEIRIKAINP
ncbi:MAG TPA: hypothetical protein VF950_05150 [Planctomycetota bacterium]